MALARVISKSFSLVCLPIEAGCQLRLQWSLATRTHVIFIWPELPHSLAAGFQDCVSLETVAEVPRSFCIYSYKSQNVTSVTFCLSRRSQSFLLMGEHQKMCDHVLKSLVFSWVLVGYFLLTWLQSHWSFPMSCPICCQTHLMYTLFCVFPFYNFHLFFLSFQECGSSFLIYYLIFLW